MLSLIISVLALGVIITIHELGHFLAARAMGIGVIEFSIGMGPRLCSAVRGNVRYSLRAFPFGGSCMMLGEELDESDQLGESDQHDGGCSDADAEQSDTEQSNIEQPNTEQLNIKQRIQEDTGHKPELGSPGYGKANIHNTSASEFNNGTFEHYDRSESEDFFIVDGRKYPKDAQFVSKAAWRRFIVIAAGPVFNFLLAFVLSAVICGWFGFDRPYVRETEAGGPMAEAGIEPGDSIYALSVGGTRMSVQTARDISIFMYVHADEMNSADTFTVFYRDASDNNIKKQASVTPFYDSENERYRLGFAYNVAYEKTDGILDTLVCSQYNVNYCIRSSVESLRMIARGKVTRQDVMGPVRMVAVMDETVNEAADYGLKSSVLTLFDLMLLISASLGFMNLLPLPALDGGRLLFIIIEMITGRAVPKELEAKIHTVGMLLLLGFMVLVMANDISMLVR